ncbi:MAG: PAS domain-containing protein [Bacteroidota bacterium]
MHSDSHLKYLTPDCPAFLKGGGEMGKLTRDYNWSDHKLGAPENWPQSLKTTLSILLNSKFPMFLFLGNDLTCFYNDAYRPSLGNNGKHPFALGQKGEDCWPEIWSVIKPLIDQVLAGGGATWSEDQLIPIYRNGKLEDVYWTFSYSPVENEEGKVVAVLVICSETTEKVLVQNQLSFAIEATELGTWDYNPLTNKFNGNRRLKEWFGVAPEGEVELDLAINVMAKEDQARVTQAIQNALKYESGGLYDIEYSIVHPVTKRERIVKAKGKAVFNENKVAYRFTGTLQDFTKEALARKKEKEIYANLRNVIAQAPVAMCILRGSSFIVEIANDQMFELWGKSESEVLGKPIFEGLPEAKEQGIERLLFNVYSTGERFIANEMPVNLPRNGKMETVYINFVYEAIKNEDGTIEGIVAIATDVTTQVLSRKKIEESEEKLSIVINSSQLGIWELNLQTSEVDYSDRYLEIIGLKSRSGFSHAELMKQIHPDDLEKREKAMKEAIITGTYNNVTRVIWSDKSIRWVHSNGKVFYDDLKKPIKMIGTVRDITQEKRQLEVLEKSEAKFRLLADSMPQHIWTTDTEGIVNYFNQSLYDYSGLTKEQIEKDGWLQIVHPDDKEQNIKKWGNAIATGQNFLFEHRFRRHDGEYRWQLSRAIPQRDSAGIIQMWVGTSTDIQDKKVIEVQLDKLVKERTIQLERSNDDLQQFAHVASHDLKEPLRKIKIYTNRAKSEYDTVSSETLISYLDKITSSCARMQMMVDGILSFSSLNAGQQTIQPINLNDVFNNVKNDLEILVEEKNSIISYDNLPVIEGAEVLIYQLFYNLVQNALKFSKQDESSAVKITSSLVKEKGIEFAIIKVQDNGIGFDQQYIHQIFETFTRLNAKDEYEGTGLGLTLCKKIAERHGGTIEAESVQNRGSVFIVKLPFKQLKHII